MSYYNAPPLKCSCALIIMSIIYYEHVMMSYYKCSDWLRCSPELLGDEDDSSLHDGGGEHHQHLVIVQTAEERPEVHVFEPGLGRTRQTDDLRSED